MREYHLIALTLIVCIFHITHMFGVIGPIYATECARLCMVCPFHFFSFHASASLGPHKCFCSACKMLNCKSRTFSNSCLVQQVPFISFILKPWQRMQSRSNQLYTDCRLPQLVSNTTSWWLALCHALPPKSAPNILSGQAWVCSIWQQRPTEWAPSEIKSSPVQIKLSMLPPLALMTHYSWIVAVHVKDSANL